MKRITIKEALGKTNYKLSDGIDDSHQVEIAFPDGEISENSLVYYTEKENSEPMNISFLGQKPYAALVNNTSKIHSSDVPIIRTDSVRSALAYSYSNQYEIDYSKMKIIGITGTNGKTTTATVIFKILRMAGWSVGFIGTGKILINDTVITGQTYSMTTPDPGLLYYSLAKMEECGCDFVVMEISSHSLALKKVDPIPFEYAVFTNLSEEHMDFHHSIEEYYQSKLSLFKKAKKGLFNMDDLYSRRGYKEALCEKECIGIIYDADVYATDIKTVPFSGSSFYYRAKDLMFGVKTKLFGSFNIYNILCAIKCVIDLGIKPCVAKNALEQIDSIDGRMEYIKSDITIIIDYAHTANAFENCLKNIFSANNQRQKSTVVFGCGGNRDKNKREPMGRIASTYANKIILTEDNSRNESFSDIISDISKGIDSGEYRVIKNRENAIRTAISEAVEGEIIAIVGKGHERYKIENGKYIPFDERKIIEDSLNIRKQCYENQA